MTDFYTGLYAGLVAGFLLGTFFWGICEGLRGRPLPKTENRKPKTGSAP